MPTDAQRILELRSEADRQAGAARYEADRHRALAQSASDDAARAAHERGAQSYDQLAEQHVAMAAQRQVELEAAHREAGRAADAERLAQEQQAELERQREEESRRRTAELEAELQRYRIGRDRTRGLER